MNFFITGFPRSGTTLLTNILNCECMCAIPPETRFYEEIGVFDSLSGKELKALLKSSNRLGDVISSSEIELLFDDIGTYNTEQVLRAIVEHWSNSCGIDYNQLGEKSPVHQLHMAKILKRSSNAKFIFIVRDPLFVVNSVLKAGWGHTNPYKITAMYVYRHFKVQKLISQENRVYTVFYEQLVQSKDEVIADICAFLELNRREVPNKAFLKLASPEWEDKWKSGSQNKLVNGNETISELTPKQKILCEHMLRDVMASLQYQPRYQTRLWAKMTANIIKALFITRFVLVDFLKSVLGDVIPIKRILGNRVVSKLKNEYQ